MKKGEMPGGDAQDHRIRITLTSTNTANVEKGKQHSHFSFPPPFSLSFLKNTTPLFLLLLSFVSGASPSSAFLSLPCSVFYWPFFLKKNPPSYPRFCHIRLNAVLFVRKNFSTRLSTLQWLMYLSCAALSTFMMLGVGPTVSYIQSIALAYSLL